VWVDRAKSKASTMGGMAEAIGNTNPVGDGGWPGPHG